LLEFNQRVFVYEDGNWAAKGRYKTALEDNNDISWTFDELDTLHLLIVSKQYYFSFKGLKLKFIKIRLTVITSMQL
jgi:hypothetical protein